MVNSMYAILSAHLQRLYPKVSSACFIDDVKIWAMGLFSSGLEKAFNELVAYDTAVGFSRTKVDFDTTFLLARKTKRKQKNSCGVSGSKYQGRQLRNHFLGLPPC